MYMPTWGPRFRMMAWGYGGVFIYSRKKVLIKVKLFIKFMLKKVLIRVFSRTLGTILGTILIFNTFIDCKYRL